MKGGGTRVGGWLILATLVGCGTPAGDFDVVTYNVAGLPQAISGSNPETNSVLISPLLNGFDLVLLQEDFSYHPDIVSAVDYPYLSTPATPVRLMNDGLNRMSNHAFGEVARHTWEQCFGQFDNGSDCLADKGFSVATTQIGGVGVDVYNLHMDAGGSLEDAAVRSTQVDQLLAEILSRSAGRPIIVAGDTNLKPAERPDDADSLSRLVTQAGLFDVCVAVGCPEPGRIDRLMFRGTDELVLAAKTWEVAVQFVDAAGLPLSDHEAIVARLYWERPLGPH